MSTRKWMMAHAECIEVCDRNVLIGYAILFSSGWDAYVYVPYGKLECVFQGNADERDAAIEAIKREARR